MFPPPSEPVVGIQWVLSCVSSAAEKRKTTFKCDFLSCKSKKMAWEDAAVGTPLKKPQKKLTLTLNRSSTQMHSKPDDDG